MLSKNMRRRSLAITKANVRTGFDAAAIIAARAQSLMSLSGKPAEKGREARRMEQIDAAVEGALAAQAAWSIFMLKAAFGGVRSPDDVSRGLSHVAEAAAAPARRKARANAKRLAGAKALL